MVGNFFGYYVKCQGKDDTIAVIFGTADVSFVQIITKDNSYYTEDVDKCDLDDNAMTLEIKDKDLVVKGEIKFGEFTQIDGDIMGPFRFLPFMECRHMIASMRHDINGKITINGKVYNFDGGLGYIEGDKGRGFPRKYFWTQAHLGTAKSPVDVSASCAIIPYMGVRFKGTICVVMIKGKEYRLATYKGAKVERFDKSGLVVRQGELELAIEVLDDKNSRPLKAPTSGKMKRIIHESIQRKVHYKFSDGGKMLVDESSTRAGFEFSDLTSPQSQPSN